MIPAEVALLSHLTDIVALEKVARSGFDPDVMPTQPLRVVVEWALKEYQRTGCLQAPSREALMATWAQKLEDAEYELIPEDEEVDSVEWAMEWFNSNYIHAQWQQAVKASAKEVAEAEPDKRVAVLQDWVSRFSQLALQVSDRTGEFDAASGLADVLRRHDERAGGLVDGMKFGLPEVDEHTGGIQPGELAILAAGPKVGKSLWLARSAFLEYLSGRNVALMTLENSGEMTMDRIVAMVLNIDYRRLQRGQCSPEELARVQAMRERTEELTNSFHTISPARGMRTMSSMVQYAVSREVESLYIDQLTFVEHANPARKAGWELVRDKLHDVKALISTGNRKIPCLLAHQINREGVKAAEKSGQLDMTMLAESSEVERTADWVFGLYAGPQERTAKTAKLQMLAARREILRSWLLTWRPAEGGDVSVLRELS